MNVPEGATDAWAALNRALDALADAVPCESLPDAWFDASLGLTAEARARCQGCPVAMECLDYALAADERYGVWGGLDEAGRRRLRTHELRSHERHDSHEDPDDGDSDRRPLKLAGCGAELSAGAFEVTEGQDDHSRLRLLADGASCTRPSRW